jgi:hypothetical protein
MNWSAQVFVNHCFYLILGVAGVITALPPEILDIIPPKAKPYVVTAIAIAVWIKGHINMNMVPPPPPAQPPAK